jgi:hypothetical protein
MFSSTKLYEADGTDAGEAHYAFLVEPGETIVTGAGGKVRVLGVVPVEEEVSPLCRPAASGVALIKRPSSVDRQASNCSGESDRSRRAGGGLPREANSVALQNLHRRVGDVRRESPERDVNDRSCAGGRQREPQG